MALIRSDWFFFTQKIPSEAGKGRSACDQFLLNRKKSQ